MLFSQFLTFIPKITIEAVSAIEAHKKMAPLQRIKELEKINLENLQPRKAAVLMLFYPKNEETHLLLIIRNSYPGVHSSQIAFPGGKYEDQDLILENTALRETEEEIGVSKDKVKIVRPFSQVYIPPSNFLVSPFMAVANEELCFTLQEDEVAGLIEWPLQAFLNEKNVVIKKISTSYAANIEVPTFAINSHNVWGATAMMLSELKEILKKVLM